MMNDVMPIIVNEPEELEEPEPEVASMVPDVRPSVPLPSVLSNNSPRPFHHIIPKKPVLVQMPKKPVQPMVQVPKKQNLIQMPSLLSNPVSPIIVDEPEVAEVSSEISSMEPAAAGGLGLLGALRNRKQEIVATKPSKPVVQLEFVEGEDCVEVPGAASVQSHWYNGGNEQITAKILVSIPVPSPAPADGSILINFNGATTDIQVWEAEPSIFTENRKSHLFKPNNPVALSQVAGGTFNFDFIATIAAEEAEVDVYLCRNLAARDVVPDYPDYEAEPDAPIIPEVNPDEIVLDYSLGVKNQLPDHFASLMPNRPKVPGVVSRRPGSIPSLQSVSTSHQTSHKTSARCQGDLGRPVKAPKQTDATNFTAAPDQELEIFPYDLNELIHKSILFYEAQRAGELPESNRIPWRGDSVMRDGCDVGVDLSKGWFDAGDYVKFTFPAAFTTTMLAWSLIDGKVGYIAAGEYENGLDQVRWGLEYLIKCHYSPTGLVVMVGDPHQDHGVWGRPEDIRMSRKTFVVTEQNGGTEPAAEAAAALAAGAVAFAEVDPEFSAECLVHAKQLLKFADQKRRSYHESVPKVKDFYKSWNGYEDELCWATAWMYKASQEAAYLRYLPTIMFVCLFIYLFRLAMYYYDKFNCGKVEESFDWDKKQVLSLGCPIISSLSRAATRPYRI